MQLVLLILGMGLIVGVIAQAATRPADLAGYPVVGVCALIGSLGGVAVGHVLRSHGATHRTIGWPYQQLDLIVSDVRMPRLSGTDAVRQMRTCHWQTPVILLTAYDDPQLERVRSGLGVANVFLKPFDLDDLRTAVLNTLTHLRAPIAAPQSRNRQSA